MRTLLSLALLTLLGFSAAWADDEKKDDDKKDDSKAKVKQLTTAGTLTGKITDISGDGRKFVIEIEGEVPYFYRSTHSKYTKTKTKKEKAEIDVKLADDAKVRLPIDPDEADAKKSAKDKGKDSSEKDPDPKLPGKHGTPDDLKKYQIVSVTFGQSKDKPPRLYGTLVLVQKDRLSGK